MSRGRYYLIIFVCLIIIFNTVRSFGDFFVAKDRVRQAQDNLDALKKENEALLKEKRRVDSPNFIEEEARNRLGMSKPGETVVVLPENLQAVAGAAVEVREPNWKKWLKLVF